MQVHCQARLMGGSNRAVARQALCCLQPSCTAAPRCPRPLTSAAAWVQTPAGSTLEHNKSACTQAGGSTPSSCAPSQAAPF